MLVHLGIKNFTTVDVLDLELSSGLTTITGETGAGKSVVLDALGLALGDRSNNGCLRDEKHNAEINASFTLNAQSKMYQWLKERDLLTAEDESEAILRRVITPSGRSRAYINGVAVNITDLKHLGEQLVDLHNQHEHQSLLDKQTHRQQVDDYADNRKLAEEVRKLAHDSHKLELQIQSLRSDGAVKEARLQLLSYQVQELDKLALLTNEPSTLAAEQKKLANAEQLLSGLIEAGNYCDSSNGHEESTGALQALQHATQLLRQLAPLLPELKTSLELVESASIQVEEAQSELQAITDQLSIDPQRLQDVENRLDIIYTIARKHHIKTDELLEFHQQLAQELAHLEGSDAHIEELLVQQQDINKAFTAKAKKLSKKRQTAAKKLAKLVNQQLTKLKMAHCVFEISIQPFDNSAPNANGLESIEFMISTIPGKPVQALSKIASGGELSRISLAIQVVTAQTSNIPTLVFDEVDVGIGGGVAEVVGNLLRELGKSGQVFCVTHLAQVAAKGDTHLLAKKSVTKTTAITSFSALDRDGRTAEMARMMGGLDVTDSTIAHASEMLETA